MTLFCVGLPRNTNQDDVVKKCFINLPTDFNHFSHLVPKRKGLVFVKISLKKTSRTIYSVIKKTKRPEFYKETGENITNR